MKRRSGSRRMLPQPRKTPKEPTARQYGMLRDFKAEYKNGLIPLSAGTGVKQSIFKWGPYWEWLELVDNPRKRELGWKITEKGHQAIELVEHPQYQRRNDSHMYSPSIAALSDALAGKHPVAPSSPPQRHKQTLRIVRRKVA